MRSIFGIPMSGFKRYRSWQPSVRRLFTGLVLIAYLITAVGLPLPAIAGKDCSEPFPCQNHACGCQSAEQCWRHCCCFSPEEKLAWAIANRVAVPAYAEPVRVHGWQTVRLGDQAKAGHKRCANCSEKGKSTVDSTARQPRSQSTIGSQTTSHCRSESCPTCSNGPSAKSDRNPKRSLGVAALRCQGLSTLWVSTGAAPPPPRESAWLLSIPVIDHVSYPDFSAQTLPSIPPDPPPRGAAVV